MEVAFDVYGLAIRVASEAADVANEVARDFAYFRAPPRAGGLEIEIRAEAPRYGELPAATARFATPRNICFVADETTYIDYFGRGLATIENDSGRCTIQAEDPDLLREIAYLFILSRAGVHLDARGLHRIHALGVAVRERGFLVLAPSGGGKSTLALSLLREPDVGWLSEDTPLLDRDGGLHAFPLRLGVRAGEPTGAPADRQRTVRRMEFDQKTLIDLDCFADRIVAEAAPAAVLVAERNLGDVCSIEPLSRSAALKAIVKDCVVGLGIYQGMEFVFERGMREVVGKLPIAASRLRSGLRLLGRASAHRLVLGRDRDRNCRVLVEFFNRPSAAHP